MNLRVSEKLQRTAYVVFVDDDSGIANSMKFLLEAEKIPFQHFVSGDDFMQACQDQPDLLQGPGCLFLDIRMPGVSGLEVFDWLRNTHPNAALPVIFMTGHGDVPIVTRVLKEGAFDFIQKPFSGEDLILRIGRYFAESQTRWMNNAHFIEVRERVDSLTERERLIMQKLFEGLSNKEIAEQLGNSVRTVELRRASIYDKLKVRSAVELARLLDSIDWPSPN